ncbi:MAG: PAS domain S-box protein [Parafilimonas sp.]
MQKTLNRIVFAWNNVVGSEESFSMENRLYNVVCVLTIAILFIFLGNSLMLHLWQSAVIAAAVMLLQFVFFYFSRFKKRFNKSIILNAIVGYVALYFNFFVNSGSNGPTLFVFFLTFHLLIAITPNKMHIVWIALHIASICVLLSLERLHPKFIIHNYATVNDRIVDIVSTYVVSLLFTYFIVRHLRNYLNRQKRETEASALKLKAMFESSDSCQIFLDRKMQVLYFNRGSAEFFNRMYQKEIIMGMSMQQVINPAYFCDFEKNFKQALQGVSMKEDRLLKYYDSENIWWHISYTPVIDDLQNTIGVSFVASDITEVKTQQENIRRKNESLMKIAHIQAHETRTPVVNILGIMELIKSEGYENAFKYLPLMEIAVLNLDEKIKEIVEQTNQARKNTITIA